MNKNHRSRGPSGMRSDHLKGWLEEARKKEREEAASEQATMEEGKPAVPDGTGVGGRRRRREGGRILRKLPTRRGWLRYSRLHLGRGGLWSRTHCRR